MTAYTLALAMLLPALGTLQQAVTFQPAVTLQQAGTLQGKTTGTKQEQKPEKKQAKKPELWPKLKPVRRSIAKDKISLLGSKNAKRVAAARTYLIKYGPGVCPVLLRSLTSRQKPAIAKQLRSLLDELTEPKHAAGLEAAYNPKNQAIALYVVERLRSFKLERLTRFFERAARHKNPEIVDEARFAAAELGDTRVLPYLFEQAESKWKERALDLIAASPALKSEASTEFPVDKLRSKELTTKLASLRLLWGMGTKAAVGPVANHLNSSEHVLRIGAVNALRGIVDNDAMYKHLSVFDAIGEVKKWKGKTGR